MPHTATAKVGSLIGTRRGAPMGFDSRPGWKGWDTVWAEMPQSEVSDLIVDLRSLTQGVGTWYENGIFPPGRTGRQVGRHGDRGGPQKRPENKKRAPRCLSGYAGAREFALKGERSVRSVALGGKKRDIKEMGISPFSFKRPEMP